jgi:hypothetical protein
MLAILASLLPNLLLNGLHSYLQATTTIAVEGEKTKREVTLATVNGVVAMRQAQSSVIEAGMGHKAFWIPWTTAAMFAVAWYAWGMVDSTWPGHLPHVAALPPQLLELTNQIWNNMFLSGSIALGGGKIASALSRISGAGK